MWLQPLWSVQASRASPASWGTCQRQHRLNEQYWLSNSWMMPSQWWNPPELHGHLHRSLEAATKSQTHWRGFALVPTSRSRYSTPFLKWSNWKVWPWVDIGTVQSQCLASVVAGGGVAYEFRFRVFWLRSLLSLLSLLFKADGSTTKPKLCHRVEGLDVPQPSLWSLSEWSQRSPLWSKGRSKEWHSQGLFNTCSGQGCCRDQAVQQEHSIHSHHPWQFGWVGVASLRDLAVPAATSAADLSKLWGLQTLGSSNLCKAKALVHGELWWEVLCGHYTRPIGQSGCAYKSKDPEEVVNLRIRLKEWTTSGCLNKQASHRPSVHFGSINLLSNDQLRTSVPQASHLAAWAVSLLGVFRGVRLEWNVKHSSRGEVTYFHSPELINENVVWLQIPMHKTLMVQVVQAPQHLGEVALDVFHALARKFDLKSLEPNWSSSHRRIRSTRLLACPGSQHHNVGWHLDAEALKAKLPLAKKKWHSIISASICQLQVYHAQHDNVSRAQKLGTWRFGPWSVFQQLCPT